MRYSQTPYLSIHHVIPWVLLFIRLVRRANSHGGVRELLLGEVERVIGRGDAVAPGVLRGGQVRPQDGVVSNTEEGHHAVPGLVVEPHLPGWR